jgi:hypothetical protein
MKPRSSSIKTFLSNAALTLVAFACAFAAGEAVVRFKFKESNVLFPRYHTDYKYGRYTLRGVRPNAEYWHSSVDGSWKFVTNSRGFRNTREFAYAKDPGTLRILSIGDSHTEGFEVRQDYTFSAVAERFLRDRKIPAEAINAGVSGYSTAEALAFLESEGYRYNPDVVVLGFFENDFEDNLKAGLFGLDAGQRLVAQKYEYVPGVKIQNVIYSLAPVRWLSENSYFYSLLFNGVWVHFKNRATMAAVAAGAKAPAHDGLEYAVATSASRSASDIALAAALIERMQQFCASRGIRLIVLDIPGRRDANHFVASMPPALVERLKASGVELVASESLLAGFQGAAQMHAEHGNEHISEFTHTLTGAEIGRRLAGASALAARQ